MPEAPRPIVAPLEELEEIGFSVNDIDDDVRKKNLHYLHDMIRGYWALLFDANEKLVDFCCYPTFLPTHDEKDAVKNVAPLPFADGAKAIEKNNHIYIQALLKWIVEHTKQGNLLLVLSCPENQCHYFDDLPKILEENRCPPLSEMVFSTYNFDDLISIYTQLRATMEEMELPVEVREEIKRKKDEQKKKLEEASKTTAGIKS